MIRSDIIERFRTECPEIPSRVIPDALLYDWCADGDKEFCAETRCIVDQDGTTITTVEDEYYWDLTAEISNFYDVDDYPGSGVLYNGKRLTKCTMADLDNESLNWRARGSGVPKKWYRRGKYLYLDRKIDSAIDDLIIYAVLISTDWTTDVAPYNQLTYLEPFHPAMILYLKKRAKAKVGKPEEAIAAAQEYGAYLNWAKKQLGGNKFSSVYFQPKESKTYGKY
jgi:hypothetical protein